VTVYFIAPEDAEEPVKIGFTAHPIKKRLRALQCVSPLRLRVIATAEGGRDVEKRLHSIFATGRLWGEWFKPCQTLRIAAETTAKGKPLSAERLDLLELLALVRTYRNEARQAFPWSHFDNLIDRCGLRDLVNAKLAEG